MFVNKFESKVFNCFVNKEVKQQLMDKEVEEVVIEAEVQSIVDELCEEVVTQTKSSFDRFGDDLTELIVSYLSFEDQIRLECLSKYWKNSVFNQIFELKVNNNSRLASKFVLNMTAFQSVLKKCPNLKIISFDRNVVSDGRELSLIGQYCPHIEELEYVPSFYRRTQFLDFGRQYGHRLKRLFPNSYDFHWFSPILTIVIEFLRFCPNLEEISAQIFGTKDNTIKDPNFLPNIKSIKGIKETDRFTEPQLDKFEKLVDKYYKTIISLQVTVHRDQSAILSLVARFESLVSLDLNFNDIDDSYSITRIGQNCTQLKRLNIRSFCISDEFFNVFTHFKSLEDLKLHISSHMQIYGSVKSLKYCSQLKKLYISCPQLSEDFFDSIQTYSPNIRFINIETGNPFSEQFFKSLSSMAYLKKVIHKLSYYNDLKSSLYLYRKLWKSYDPNSIEMLSDNCTKINTW
jgi:hypothetical protein